MTDIVPLICCPSPRNIPEVQKAWYELPYDRLEAKYFLERTAYKLLRSWFLRHEKYTHLVICPDDLVVKPEHVQTLINDLKKHDLPVLSGVFNVDLDENKDFLAITQNLPHPTHPKHIKKNPGDGWPPAWRWYAWVHKNQIGKEGITQFPHLGFGCQFIRRDVMESIPFKDDAEENGLSGTTYSSGVDVMFSNQCALANVPLYADTRVRMLHLRKHGPIDITWGNGELRFIEGGMDNKHVVLLRGASIEKAEGTINNLKIYRKQIEEEDKKNG